MGVGWGGAGVLIRKKIRMDNRKRGGRRELRFCERGFGCCGNKYDTWILFLSEPVRHVPPSFWIYF